MEEQAQISLPLSTWGSFLDAIPSAPGNVSISVSMHLLGSDSNVVSTIKAFLTFGLEINCGTSLVVQWVRLHASSAGGAGLIPGWGPKIPHTAQYGQKEKNKMDVIKDQAVSLPT